MLLVIRKSLYSVDTIKLITGENDIILDCFAGSGTWSCYSLKQ